MRHGEPGHRILVMGATGWLGSAVLAQARVCGGTVAGGARHGSRQRGIEVCDASDARAVVALCARFRPTVLVNCVRREDVGVAVVRSLLQGARHTGARLVQVGSAAEYGEAFRRGRPLGERAIPRPLSAYGKAKAAETAIALAALDDGADVVVARVFNLIGPGEREGTV